MGWANQSPSPASLLLFLGQLLRRSTSKSASMPQWILPHPQFPHKQLQPCPRGDSVGAVLGLCDTTDFLGLSTSVKGGKKRPFVMKHRVSTRDWGGLHLAACMQGYSHEAAAILAIKSGRMRWGKPP